MTCWQRFALIGAALTLLATCLSPAPARAADGTTHCHDLAVPVVVDGRPGDIVASLCEPPHAEVLQVLVPGNTYTREYWSAPAMDGYVGRAVRDGYATLAIDRLGTGKSLHPPSSAMTLDNDAATIHTVVDAVRSGRFGTFSRVVGVGHSLGSVVVHQAAGRHPGDFDALVLTGFSHLLNAVNAAGKVIPRYAPTVGDPRFASLDLDPLYLTVQPGGRRAFYARGQVDPAVLAWDDATPDVGNAVELAQLGGFQTPNLGREIHGPVLIVDGSADAVACGLTAADCRSNENLLASERPWFSPRTHLDAWAVPGTGHNVTLHRNALEVDGGILAWTDSRIGHGIGECGAVLNGAPQPISVRPRAAPDPSNEILDQVGSLAADNYTSTTATTPGLGDSTNPLPVTNDLARSVASPPGKAIAPAVRILPRRRLSSGSKQTTRMSVR